MHNTDMSRIFLLKVFNQSAHVGAHAETFVHAQFNAVLGNQLGYVFMRFHFFLAIFTWI